ncbi:hypothetical protein BH11VER1_BH11VER1_36010 [soil metagenome]
MQASWIDFDELRSLAAALQDPAVEEAHEEVWNPEPLLDDTFVPELAPFLATFSAPTPPPIVLTSVREPTAQLQTLSAQLRTIKEQAQDAGLLPVVQEEPAAVSEEPFYLQHAPIPQEPPVDHEPVLIPEPPVFEEPIDAVPVFIQPSEFTDMSQRLRNFQQFATELTGCKDLVLMNPEGDLLWGNTHHYDVMATIMIAMRYHNPTAFEATHFKLTNLEDTLVVMSTPTCHGQVFLTLLNPIHADDHRLQKLHHAMVAAIEGTSLY